MKRATRQIKIRLVWVHAPMGSSLADDGGQFAANTIRSVRACGVWGIPNLVVHSGYARGLSAEQTFEEKSFSCPCCSRQKVRCKYSGE